MFGFDGDLRLHLTPCMNISVYVNHLREQNLKCSVKAEKFKNLLMYGANKTILFVDHTSMQILPGCSLISGGIDLVLFVVM